MSHSYNSGFGQPHYVTFQYYNPDNSILSPQKKASHDNEHKFKEPAPPARRNKFPATKKTKSTSHSRSRSKEFDVNSFKKKNGVCRTNSRKNKHNSKDKNGKDRSNKPDSKKPSTKAQRKLSKELRKQIKREEKLKRLQNNNGSNHVRLDINNKTPIPQPKQANKVSLKELGRSIRIQQTLPSEHDEDFQNTPFGKPGEQKNNSHENSWRQLLKKAEWEQARAAREERDLEYLRNYGKSSEIGQAYANKQIVEEIDREEVRKPIAQNNVIGTQKNGPYETSWRQSLKKTEWEQARAAREERDLEYLRNYGKSSEIGQEKIREFRPKNNKLSEELKNGYQEISRSQIKKKAEWKRARAKKEASNHEYLETPEKSSEKMVEEIDRGKEKMHKPRTNAFTDTQRNDSSENSWRQPMKKAEREPARECGFLPKFEKISETSQVRTKEKIVEDIDKEEIRNPRAQKSSSREDSWRQSTKKSEREQGRLSREARNNSEYSRSVRRESESNQNYTHQRMVEEIDKEKV